MFFKRALPMIAAVTLSVATFVPAAHAQFTSEEIIREVVTPIDVTSGIEGALIYEEKRNRTDFTIVIDGLPVGIYTVTIGGEFRGFLSSFRTQGFETGAELVFSTRQRGNKLLLNFEPRGELVEIRSVLDNSRLYASGRLPFAVPMEEVGGVEYNKVRVREEFATIDGSFAQARLDVKSNRRKAKVNLRVKGLVPGVYNLRADGMTIGSLVAVGRGKGKLKFSTDPRRNESMLNFDPLGVMYEVVRIDIPDPDADNGTAELTSLLTMVGQAQDVGGNLPPVGEKTEVPAYAGFDEDGYGEVSMKVRNDRAELRVVLDNLPEGQYSLVVEFAPGRFDLIAPIQVVPEDENAGQEDEGEEEMPAPLPQGVGPDNNGIQTLGSVLVTTNGRTEDGEALDENGNPVLILNFDDQGLPILIIDGRDRVWFRGTYPDTGFSIDPDLLMLPIR